MKFKKIFKKQKARKKLNYAVILTKFLVVSVIVLVFMLFFRFQRQLVLADNYLTLAFGWIKFLVYFLVLSLSFIYLFNHTFINYKVLLVCSISVFFFSYLLANIFDLVNSKFSVIVQRESLNIFRNKWNALLLNYQDYLNASQKITFLTLPWINCNAGLLGVGLTFVTNFVNFLLSTICSFFGFWLLLSYYLYQKPLLLINKFIVSCLKIFAIFSFYHLIASKIAKLNFTIKSYINKKLSKKININFEKGTTMLHKNDKHILLFFKKRKTIYYHEIFNKQDFYRKRWNWNKKNKINFQGIYAFYVEDFYGKEKVFLPCYIGKSNDIIVRWRTHCTEIKYAYDNPQKLSESLAVYQRVAAYLHVNKLDPNKLNFIVLEWVALTKNLAKAEAYWINKIATTQRGWNSIRE